MFLKDGARLFVFEGRECGGHVGPRSSFVLWESMIEVLLEHLASHKDGTELQILFAGGIHDAMSAAMAAAMAAPLAKRGVRLGTLVGTGYIFTDEAVATGAIVKGFQEEIIRCERTALLETGPGHSTRCAQTPYTEFFERERKQLYQEGKSADEIRYTLEELNLGRLRIASKGITRHPEYGVNPNAPKFIQVDEAEQKAQGMYMIGQVAVMRAQVCTIEQLHRDIAVGSTQRLRAAAESHQPATVIHEVPKPADIAIVGMASLFPKAPDLQTYWENILNKVYAITEVPKERWDADLYYDPNPAARDKIYSKWGGFLDDIEFDPTQYGMPPNTLRSIEPLHLLTLEVVRSALKDAGYDQRPFNRERTSVILGAGGGAGDLGQQYGLRSSLPMLFGSSSEEGLSRINMVLPEWTEDSFAGILMNVAAGRVANRFDFGGTNFTIDAACASSMAAAAMAVRELQMGLSDMVVLGGVDTMQGPFAYLCFAKTYALSRTGQVHTFDENADGIVISEGLGAVILKRLEDAERDGDRIYAVIKGVGASSDGKAKGMTAPHPEGQVLALERAYAQAGFPISTVGLFEAHGTGTVVGDRTEVESLQLAFGNTKLNGHRCALGSVKSAIGHTKCTAGVASLIKVAMALYYKVLPPTLGVEKPNAQAASPDNPFFINTEVLPWISGGTPRRAGASAFGFGGTNFHAVLEEYQGNYLDRPKQPIHNWPTELFLWYGDSRQDIQGALEALEKALVPGAEPALADVAYTIQKQNKPGKKAIAIVAASVDDLRKKLKQAKEMLADVNISQISHPQGIYFSDRPLAQEDKIAFLFPGQGSQYVYMMRDLAIQFDEVRECFARADETLKDLTPRPLSHYIFPAPSFTDEEFQTRQKELTQTHIAQAAMGAANMGMFHLLKCFGVQPDFDAGHSYGEYVALCAAGVFDESHLVRLSEARGRFIVENAHPEVGTMAAIEANPQWVSETIEGLQGVWIANLNAPQQTIITGTENGVQTAVQQFEAKGIRAKRLAVACAFHSPLVATASQQLKEFLDEVPIRSPEIPVYSNTTAEVYPHQPEAIAEQLVEHLTKPVRFVEEIGALYEAGARIFIEVGPRNTLTGLVNQILDGKSYLALASDQPKRHGLTHLNHLLGQLAAQGVPVKLDRLYEGRALQTLNLRDLAVKKQPSPMTWLVNGNRAIPLTEASKPQIDKGTKPNVTHSETALTSKPQKVQQKQVAPRFHRDSKLPEQRQMETLNESIATLPPTNGGARSHVSTNAQPSPSNPQVAMPAHTAQTHPMGLGFQATDQGAPPHQAGTAQIMGQFQRVMNRFLETQRNVMLSYLHAGAASQEPIQPWQSAEPLQQMSSEVGVPLASEPQVSRQEIPLTGFAAETSGQNGDGPASGLAESPLQGGHEGTIHRAPLGKGAIEATSDSEVLLTVTANLSQGVYAPDANAQSTPQGAPRSKSRGVGQSEEGMDAPPQSAATLEGSEAEVAGAGSDTPLSPEVLTAHLLHIVSERTGYPPEMLELDLDLEGDLGIDSIKRVEILGSFKQIVPMAESSAGDIDIEELAGIRTLRGIIEWIEQHVPTLSQETAPVPHVPTVEIERGDADLEPQVRKNQLHDSVPRYTLTAVDAPMSGATVPLDGHVLLVTDDERGVAQSVVEQLQQQGVLAVLVQMDSAFQVALNPDAVGEVSPRKVYKANLTSPASIDQLIQEIHTQHEHISGLIHLIPLQGGDGLEQMEVKTWKERLQREVKSCFYLIKALETDLRQAENSIILVATAMGNVFTSALLSAPSMSSFPGHGGVAGLIKTVFHEWPEVRTRVVDLDPRDTYAAHARVLIQEILANDAQVEVGYDTDRRLRLQTTEAPIDASEPPAIELDASSVLLVTGGARGITAEVARELATRYQPTLLLVGRSEPPQVEEPSALASLSTPQEIKRFLINRMHQTGGQSLSGSTGVTPAVVEREYTRLMKSREIRETIDGLEALGAKVRYYQVDVRDERAFGSLIDEIYQVYGRLDGVIHGAGIIEDKFIRDKTPDSFDRVFDTKVESAFILSKKLRAESLKFLVFFSSVAGRFGNRGQCDYAAANEIYNKLAISLDEHWPGRVVSINWGPWETKESASGMVSQELQRQFAQHGIKLVPRSVGVQKLVQELCYGHKGEAELVIGGGGWEDALKDKKKSAYHSMLPPVSSPTELAFKAALPLIGSHGKRSYRDGDLLEIMIALDADRDPYLQDHQLSGKPVFPMAMALELMAEVLHQRWPDYSLATVKNMQVLQGIVLENGAKLIRVMVRPGLEVSPDGISAELVIESLDASNRAHYRATAELTKRRISTNGQRVPLWLPGEAQPFPKTIEDAYSQWLFQGPCFQGIRSIECVNTEGIIASLDPSLPADLLADASEASWLVDPVILDGALQLPILWGRLHWDITTLPSSFGCYHYFAPFSEQRTHVQVRVRPETSQLMNTIYTDVAFFDANGHLLGLVENLKHNGSKTLNRLTVK